MTEKQRDTGKLPVRKRGQVDHGKSTGNESYNEQKDRNAVFDTLEPPAPRPRPSRGN